MSGGWSLLIDAAIVLLLILGVGLFGTPGRARWGNRMAALALAFALAIVLYRNPVSNSGTVLAVFLVGSLLGSVVALRADMIQIPTMIAFQHGAGGLAACLVSYVELTRYTAPPTGVAVGAGILALAVGGATFSGSMIASGKLARLLGQKATVLPQHDLILLGAVLAVGAVGLASGMLDDSAARAAMLGTVCLSVLLGIVFSIRVGGADMPVLISFLNSTSGLCAALCGIIIHNRLLIACGATVAASGAILTHAMCKAMNRKLVGVFVGASIAPSSPRSELSRGEAAPAAGPVRTATTTAEKPAREEALSREQAVDGFARAVEAAREAKSVVIIPGYGMALAHAQRETVRLADRLQGLGKRVRFVVHPIAGRMPGHMHVLLAEAEVDPDMLFEMDEVNSEFKLTDLVVIVGACDVVNPAASLVENTPISGMPVLKAEEARQIVVFNLDDRPGYSGVPNPLYTSPNTIMVLGEAKTTVGRLLEALS